MDFQAQINKAKMLSKTKKKNQIISTNKKPFPSPQQDLFLKLVKSRAKILLEFNFHISSTLSWRSLPHTELALMLSQAPKSEVRWDCLVLQDWAGLTSAMGAIWHFWFTFSNLLWNYREDLECNLDFLIQKATLNPTYVLINPVLPSF